MKRKSVSMFTAAIVCATLLTGCGGDSYQDYSTAYKKVTAKGGLEADFALTLTMDGETTDTSGNFKLDTSGDKTMLLYEMKVGDATIVQFSDGEYIYTDNGEHKTKYALNEKPEASGDSKEAQAKDEGATFETSQFLNEFSSVLEAGKIKELGLLSPIDKNVILSIKDNKNGDKTTYAMEFSESLVKKYLNIMIANQLEKSSGEGLSIDEMKDFSYEATASGGIITDVAYSGTIKVDVPETLTSSGSAESYDLDMDIDITFVNPGSAVEITLPSTDGFDEVK